MAAILPLVLFLKPLFKSDRKGRIYAALVSLPWFAYAVSNIVVGEQMILATIQTALILLLYVVVFLDRDEANTTAPEPPDEPSRND